MPSVLSAQVCHSPALTWAEGAGGGRRLPAGVVSPAGQGAVRLHAARVIAARADLAEGAGGDVVQLPVVVVSPAGQGAVRPQPTGVILARADLAEGAVGGRGACP